MNVRNIRRLSELFHKLSFFGIPFSFVLSVGAEGAEVEGSLVTDQRAVTKSKDEQKTVSFDFGAAHLTSGRTVFKKSLLW
jgi:hypothetical protein